MESFGRRLIDKISLLLLGMAFVPGPVAGDMVLMSGRTRTVDQGYPSSRWGQAPTRVSIGLEPDYASREVAAHDHEGGISRAPAGVMPQAVHSETRQGPVVPTPEYEMMMVKNKGVQEIAVIAGDLGFFPNTVFVTRDIPVRMYVTSSSKNNLCIMMDAFQVRKQVRSRQIAEISFTPSSPGKYRYYCPVNGMEGTLVVKEFSY